MTCLRLFLAPCNCWESLSTHCPIPSLDASDSPIWCPAMYWTKWICTGYHRSVQVFTWRPVPSLCKSLFCNLHLDLHWVTQNHLILCLMCQVNPTPTRVFIWHSALVPGIPESQPGASSWLEFPPICTISSKPWESPCITWCFELVPHPPELPPGMLCWYWAGVKGCLSFHSAPILLYPHWAARLSIWPSTKVLGPPKSPLTTPSLHKSSGTRSWCPKRFHSKIKSNRRMKNIITHSSSI